MKRKSGAAAISYTPDDAMHHLEEHLLHRVREAIISSGIINSRGTLVSGIAPAFVSSLPAATNPGAQVLSDLHEFNRVPALTDGTVPIRVFLQNANALAGPRPEAHVFREALDQLRSGKPLLPGRRRVRFLVIAAPFIGVAALIGLLIRQRHLPPKIDFRLESPTSQLGSTGGDEFGAYCPRGQAVVGFQGHHEGHRIFGMSASCAHLVPSMQSAQNGEYSLMMKDAGGTYARGANNGVAFNFHCPLDSVVTKIKIQAFDDRERGGTYVNEIVATCSRYEIDDETLQVIPSEVATLDTIGKHESGARSETYTCSNNGVVTGFAGRSGSWMDSLRFSCASLSASR